MAKSTRTPASVGSAFLTAAGMFGKGPALATASTPAITRSSPAPM